MTERRPAGMSHAPWIDQQVAEAEQRGAFDCLPGTGQPLPDRGEADAGEAWLRGWVRREGLTAREMLPVPLQLRREIEQLPADLAVLRSEQAVRTVVSALNERILSWRRLPLGPPVFVPLVNEEETVAKWLAGRTPSAGAGEAGPPAPAHGHAEAAQPRTVRRWWRRPA